MVVGIVIESKFTAAEGDAVVVGEEELLQLLSIASKL